MKIFCLIDALGPGGAERQLVGLAKMLKSENDIVVCYHEPKGFFVKVLEEANIPTILVCGNRIRKIIRIRREIKQFNPETVIAYLQSSSMIACIVKFFGERFKLIVSERNTNISKTPRDYIRFHLFREADHVVTNSYSQARFIKANFSFLNNKLYTIVNFVDTERFHPVEKKRENNILVAATIWSSKNTIGFIKSLDLLKRKGIKVRVKWFGKVADQRQYLGECEELIRQLGLEDYIQLLDKTSAIELEYQKADYFCLPSFYEGTPNVICEAISSGLPVVCSDVCDNSLYVQSGINGFLFNPRDIEDMASAICKIIYLSDEEYVKFRNASRRIALNSLSKDTFILNYKKLI